MLWILDNRHVKARHRAMIAEKFTKAGADPLREDRARAEGIARRYAGTRGSMPRRDEHLERFAAEVRGMQPSDADWKDMKEREKLDWASRLASRFVSSRDGTVRDVCVQPVRLLPEHKNIFRARMDFEDGSLYLRIKETPLRHAGLAADALIEAAAVYAAENHAVRIIQRKADQMVEDSILRVRPAAFEPTDLDLYMRQPVPASAACMAAAALSQKVEQLFYDRHYAFRQQAIIDRLTAYDIPGHDPAVYAMNTINAPGGDDDERLLGLDNRTKAHLVHAITSSHWLDDANKGYYARRVIEVSEVSRDAADGFDGMIKQARMDQFDTAFLNDNTIATWQKLLADPAANQMHIHGLASAIASGVSQIYDIKSNYRVVLFHDADDPTIGGGQYNPDNKTCEIFLNLAAPELRDLPATVFVIAHELSHAAVQEAIAGTVHPSPLTRDGRHAALFEFIQLHNYKNYIHPDQNPRGYMAQPEEALANILGFQMSAKFCRDILKYEPKFEDYKAITDVIDVGVSTTSLRDAGIAAPPHISFSPLFPENERDVLEADLQVFLHLRRPHPVSRLSSASR